MSDANRPPGTAMFRVRCTRELPDGMRIMYFATVYALNGVDAVMFLGDRIRRNDVDGIQVTPKHVPVPKGEQAGIVTTSAHRLPG